MAARQARCRLEKHAAAECGRQIPCRDGWCGNHRQYGKGALHAVRGAGRVRGRCRPSSMNHIRAVIINVQTLCCGGQVRTRQSGYRGGDEADEGVVRWLRVVEFPLKFGPSPRPETHERREDHDLLCAPEGRSCSCFFCGWMICGRPRVTCALSTCRWSRCQTQLLMRRLGS